MKQGPVYAELSHSTDGPVPLSPDEMPVQCATMFGNMEAPPSLPYTQVVSTNGKECVSR